MFIFEGVSIKLEWISKNEQRLRLEEKDEN